MSAFAEVLPERPAKEKSNPVEQQQKKVDDPTA